MTQTALDAAAQLVDGAAVGPVLVHGSLPPHARDLDVLVRDAELDRLAAALGDAGFERRGAQFVRFAQRAAAVVEPVPASHWRLPPDEVDALFESARPLDGYERLVRPSPHHELLVLARDIVAGAGRIDEKRSARIRAALDDDPDAWEHALAHADAWGGPAELELLRAAYDRAQPMSQTARLGAMAHRHERAGADAARARVAAARELVSRPKIGHVVALSGLDGAGKSTQAELLVDALQALGYDAVREWTRIAAEGWIWELRHRIARVLALLSGRRGADAVAPGSGEPDAITELRKSSPLLTQAWATFVAVANAYAHQRAVARHLAAGRVVVCDRWVLDSVVHLEARFGSERSWRLQTTLIRRLSPRAVCAFLLDVPAEIAQRRKQEDDPEWLALLAQLYRREQPRQRVQRLDGTRPIDELAAAIAREVARALGR